MVRILLAFLFVAVTIFAVADWMMHSKVHTPGRINRWVWLTVILFLPLVGPLTWVVVGMVTKAEEKRLTRFQHFDRTVFRPDDNPDVIVDIVDRINRRQHRTKGVPNVENLPDSAAKECAPQSPNQLSTHPKTDCEQSGLDNTSESCGDKDTGDPTLLDKNTDVRDQPNEPKTST